LSSSGAIEAFRTLRAAHVTDSYGALLKEDRRAELTPTLVWNIEAGGRLTAQELVAIWQKHRCAIVFVMHSVDEALVLGNKIVVMTRRPGRIGESVTFDLPRPRDITSPEFNDAKRRVLALIREESTRSAQVA
jgi:hypothetical protein